MMVMEHNESHARHEPGQSGERLPPASIVKVASELTRFQLQRLVAEIQGRLYLDLDEEGTEYWDPDKEWECSDLCQEISALLDELGLMPDDVQPFSSASKEIEFLEELATSHGVVPEALDELVHECASSEASDINNGGLESQIEFLVHRLGKARARTMLQEVVESKGRDTGEG